MGRRSWYRDFLDYVVNPAASRKGGIVKEIEAEPGKAEKMEKDLGLK